MSDPKKPAELKPPASAGAAETSFFGDVVKWARSKTSAETDRSITDTITQAAKMFYSTVYGDLGKPGDQRFGQFVADRLETYMDEHGKPKNFGKYDLMMATGWQPKDPIKVNGVETTLTKPIDNMLAVFVRNKDGSIEIIDPSIKVSSLGETSLLLNALMPPGARRNEFLMTGLDDKYKDMLRKETPADQRWRETAGTFVMVQLAPMAISGGLAALGKGGAAVVSKAPQLEKAAEIGGKINSATIKTGNYIGATNGVTAAMNMGDQFSQNLYFSPAAVNKIAESFSKALRSTTISADSMRKNMNEAFHEFTYNQGSDAKQIYIPSLLDNEQPWDRMREAMQGVIPGKEKSSHPWQEWSPKNISASNIRTALTEHPGVNYAFYSSVDKHLSGKTLTDRDYFMMRAGLMLGPEDSAGYAATLNPAGKSGILKYTAEEKAETLKYIDAQLHSRLRDKLFADEVLAKKMHIDNLDTIEQNKTFTPAQIKAFVSGEAKESGAIIEAQQKAEMQKAQAHAMAFSMTH